jgi:hypothetical protein
MHDHGAVKKWSERIQEDLDSEAAGVVAEGGGRGWRIGRREAPGHAATSYVAHYLQCRCGEIFASRHAATTRSLLRAHLAQWHAEANARSGFDAAAARRDGENHSGLGGGGV